MKMNGKKVFNIVVNVVVAIILVMVAFITVNIITSGSKGYTSLFGSALVSVESNSMKGDKADDFSKGDLLVIRVLSDEEKRSLQIGDVITFYDTISGTRALNTHRVVEVVSAGVYRTAGDNNTNTLTGEVTWDETVRYADAIVGIYTGKKVAVLGSAVSFFHTTAGFFVCIVLPSLLIVAYCAFNLYRTVRESKAVDKETEKQQLKEQILREMQQNGELPPQTQGNAESSQTDTAQK
jgi:signal peptidase